MAVRSINLKLIVPRAPTAAAVRQALWTTHSEVNSATSYYEQWLLLLRSRGYETQGDGPGERRVVSTEEVEAAALSAARNAQQINRVRSCDDTRTPGTDSDVLDALRSLYDLLAPEETGTGSAQAAKGFLSPLPDPKSEGFRAAAVKLDRPRPNWLALDDKDPALLDAAIAWYGSDASRSWRSDTGSPASWLRAARLDNPAWPRLFREKLDGLAKVSASGPEAVIARLRSLRLLPLFKPFFPDRMIGTPGGVTPWDRLAFRLAVSHILSWQAWVRRAAIQHGERQSRLQDYRSRAVTDLAAELLPQVRAFERERSEALGALGLGQASYVLLPRQLRSWPDVRASWLAAKDRSPDRLRAILADHQTKKRGRFGDPQVFLWLSEPAQHRLWLDDDVVTVVATLNAMQALVERSRETATMTLPDARLHPRAVQWSAEGDSNLRPYRLVRTEPDILVAEISLLQRTEDCDKLKDIRRSFRLAPNPQFGAPTIGKRGKKAQVTFTTGGDTFTAVLGSADLLFDRPHMRNRRTDQLDAGMIGPAWLKLALDLDEQRPEGWTEDHARFTRHFAAALGPLTKAEGSVAEGARVLSVDLGLRTFAACSVFTLKAACPARAIGKPAPLSFELQVNGRVMWAAHERSFPLELPDEEPSGDGQQWRVAARAEMRRVRQALTRSRGCARLASVPPETRQMALEALQVARSAEEPFPFEEDVYAVLDGLTAAPQPIWDRAVADALVRYRRGLGPVIRDWRRKGRERQPFNHLGKSMWAIEYLTDLRRTLMSWSLLGRASGEIRRLDRTGRGTFASQLLRHLDNIKEDRLKTGADLIVRAAMGFVRDSAGRWEQRFEPCNAILFEDLSRYRMRTDRPRRENSQLMRWAHRAIPAEVKMQGALYALEVVETAAAFSSRYHARTLTPGLRCKALTKADFDDKWLRDDLLEAGIELAACRAGDLVPHAGGEMFACLRSREGGLIRTNADLNAAQNLQRRFWTRHADAFRLPCVRVVLPEGDVWVPKHLGKRLIGALGGPGLLRPTGHETGSCKWERVRPARLKQLLGTDTGGDDGAADPDTEQLTALAEEAEVQAGLVEVFFRDPSGIVLPEGLWYPGKVAWSIVKANTTSALRTKLGERTGPV